jgi:hypothetical protein
MIKNKFKDVYKVLTFNNSINTSITQNSFLETFKFIILSHKILSPLLHILIMNFSWHLISSFSLVENPPL